MLLMALLHRVCIPAFSAEELYAIWSGAALSLRDAELSRYYGAPQCWLADTFLLDRDASGWLKAPVWTFGCHRSHCDH